MTALPCDFLCAHVGQGLWERLSLFLYATRRQICLGGHGLIGSIICIGCVWRPLGKKYQHLPPLAGGAPNPRVRRLTVRARILLPLLLRERGGGGVEGCGVGVRTFKRFFFSHKYNEFTGTSGPFLHRRSRHRFTIRKVGRIGLDCNSYLYLYS